MNITKIISELREEVIQIDVAIRALERISLGTGRRGRPRKLRSVELTSKREELHSKAMSATASLG